MKYKIKYTYDTGDSFHNEYDQVGYIELEWNNFEIAKANLKRIQEHYSQYKQLNDRRNKGDQQAILEKNKHKDWFVFKPRLVVYNPKTPQNYNAIDKPTEKQISDWKKKGILVKKIIDETTAENQLILYTDRGKKFQFWPAWCGYFETLTSAEIESENLDTKISFD